MLLQATAKYWAQEYAEAPGQRDQIMAQKVQNLKDMGVSQADALSALSCNGWDVSRATEYVFS